MWLFQVQSDFAVNATRDSLSHQYNIGPITGNLNYCLLIDNEITAKKMEPIMHTHIAFVDLSSTASVHCESRWRYAPLKMACDPPNQTEKKMNKRRGTWL